MKATRIDHVAVVVKDLEGAVATYQHNFDLEKAGGGEVPVARYSQRLSADRRRPHRAGDTDVSRPVRRRNFWSSAAKGCISCRWKSKTWTRPWRI